MRLALWMKKARRTVHGCKDGCDKAAVDGDVDVVKDSMAEMEVGVVVSGEGGMKSLAISVVSCHGFFFARMEGWVWECRNRG